MVGSCSTKNLGALTAWELQDYIVIIYYLTAFEFSVRNVSSIIRYHQSVNQSVNQSALTVNDILDVVIVVL